MKIGFGTTVLTRGLSLGKLDGIGVYTQSLLNVLKKSKHKIINLRFYTREEILSDDIVLKHKLSYSVHSGISAILNYPFGDFTQHEKEIDIFFAPDHHIPHLKKTPVIATVMDIIPFVHPEWTSQKFRKLKNYAFKKAILSADHIITISEYSKSDIVNYFGVRKDKISVISLGVDQKYFSTINNFKKEQVLNKYNIKKDFFLFIGTLQPRKNILRIIDAFERLPVEIKEVNELIIVGQNGWQTDDLIEKLDALKKSGYGQWLNYVPEDEVLALFQSALALVYPSLYEGFGLPIVEAFASRCPVISSNTTSIPEVAGEAALLVDPYSIQEISDAMKSMASDQNLRESLISRGLEQVKQFTWEKSAQEHMDVFQKVLAN